MPARWNHILIIGASSGIGEEMAKQLAPEGGQFALVARRQDELTRVAEEVRKRGGQATTYVHDVREYECVPALFQQIARDLGGLDLVVYASGVLPRVEPDEYDFAKDRQMIEVNLLGAMAWLNEAAARFERARAGTIVGISSVAGERGRRSMPAYCTSKAALNTYLEAIRNRIGRFGVAVVTVKPGPVDTPMTKGSDNLPLLIPVEKAAASIIAAARRGSANAYVPGVWRYIFLILRNIPSFVFKKLNV